MAGASIALEWVDFRARLERIMSRRRFTAEPQPLPQYLIEGLQILADQTDEQPWPPPEMARLLRAMASGCAIQYGNKGYFEVVTRTFHVGLVSELLSECCLRARDVFWEQVEEARESQYYYFLGGTGSTQRRKKAFKYKQTMPLTLDSGKLKTTTYAELVLAEIRRTLTVQAEEGDDSAVAPWREDELKVAVEAQPDDGSRGYYRSAHYVEVRVSVSKERVLNKLGYPSHVGE